MSRVCNRFIREVALLFFQKAGSALAPACDAFDFAAHQPFNEAWKIIVQPSLQHRPQHLANEIFQGARVLHQNRLRQRIER